MPTIPERLARIENTLERLDHTLNGNGQPGWSQKMERFITELYRLGDRVTVIEDTQKTKKLDWQWLVTAVIGIGAIAVAFWK